MERKTGLSHSYISQIERGERGRNGAPAPATLAKLALALEIPYQELMIKAGYLDKNNIDNQYNFGRELAKAESSNDLLNKVNAILDLISDGVRFHNFLDEDIKAVEIKYEPELETNENLTPSWVREKVFKMEWDSEWIYNLVRDLMKVVHDNNLHVQLETKELFKFLMKEDITYKGELLTDQHKKLLKSYLDALFIN